MKITLLQDFGAKSKGTSYELSAPTATTLISKGIAVKFGEEASKKAKKESKSKDKE
jgi:hypothetical protein